MGRQKIEELLSIDFNAEESLHRQLYLVLVKQINLKELQEGDKLPASRKLAQQLNISRNTVQKAYDQLQIEGYIETKLGSGVFVSAHIPDDYCQVLNDGHDVSVVKNESPEKDFPFHQHRSANFAPGVPNLKAFPHQQWNQVARKVLKEKYLDLLQYNSFYGLSELQKTIANYLKYARGVKCSAEQIIITNGAQEAINLVSRVLLAKKKSMAMENPGYIGAVEAFKNNGAHIIPIPILKDGLDIAYLKKQRQHLQCLYITPSHQYPLGATLSVNQRLEILQWAEKNKSYIIEDDYDSEYHYKAKPLPSLQGLDTKQRVIYIGTFSKVLFPALRLGFIIAPPQLLADMQNMKRYGFGATPLFNQYVLNTFMQAGYLNKHIKMMRLHYAKKQQFLMTCCRELLPKKIILFTNDIGLHITLQFSNKTEQEKATQVLNTAGFYPTPLSNYYFSKQKKYGLVIGFANTSMENIKKGVQLIASCFQ